MTREEFISLKTAAEHQSNRLPRNIIWALYGGFIMAFVFVLLIWLLELCGVERLDPRFRNDPAEVMADFRVGMLWVFGMAVVVLGLILLAYWIAVRRFRNRFSLRCPSCYKFLTDDAEKSAVATGCCGHCGQLVFDE